MSSARVGLTHTYIYLGAANPSTQPGSAKEADIGIYIYTYIYTHTHTHIYIYIYIYNGMQQCSMVQI